MDSFSHHICDHPQTHLTELPPPEHGSLAALSARSNCGDCDCPIVGKAFHCDACDSDLHPFCKNRPPNFTCSLHTHPLTLLPGGFVHRRCTVCDEEIKRVHYTCSGCEFDIHPVCSQLPLVIPDGHRPLRLQLGGDTDTRGQCVVCSRECGKWAYRCDVPSVTLIHYSCLSENLIRSTGTGGDPAPDHQSRSLFGQAQAPWWSYPPYYHYGAYGAYNYGQGYGGGFQGDWAPNHCNYNHHNHHNGGGGSTGGSGGWGGWIGRICNSLAVGVLSNLFADPIQNALFGN